MEGENRNLRVVEFFSGIGGWRAALSRITEDYEIVVAFDINPMANLVYSSRYHCQPSNKSIENLASSYLDSLNSNMWLMSPPCQPFTRNNTTESRDTNDPRAKAFENIIDLIPKLRMPPQYLALENVVGFEESDCCQKFLHVLRETGYQYCQFILTPTQLGIPNSRPRYFLIASRRQNLPYQAIPSVPALPAAFPRDPSEASDFFQTIDPSTIYTTLPESSPLLLKEIPCRSVSEYLELEIPDITPYLVPESILRKPSSWCFDIVTAESVHTACFTKGYGRYIKGTGSILQFLPSSADRETDLPPAEHLQQTVSEDETPNMKRQKLEDAEAPQTASAPEDLVTTPQTLETLIGKLRYFTPEELLRLFGFDSPPLSSGSPTVGGFFPIDEKLTLRKKYELIGNSLNVTVASLLLQLLLGSKEGR